MCRIYALQHPDVIWGDDGTRWGNEILSTGWGVCFSSPWVVPGVVRNQ